jgi:hypothetical protein
MEKLTTFAFSFLLYGVSVAMKLTAWRYPVYRERLKERDVVAQIRVREGPGRYFVIRDGKLTSKAGIHPVNVHVHKSRQDELVGQVYHANISALRLEKSRIDVHDAIAFDRDRLRGKRRFAGYREQGTCVNQRDVTIGADAPGCQQCHQSDE